MPKNVFGAPTIAPKAEKGIDALISQGNTRGVRGLSKSERRMLAQGGPDIYIYNVSPIWEWHRPVPGRGEVIVQKCKQGEKVSAPLVVPNIVTRDFDRGSGVRQMYAEEGLDLAQDILGCSEEMPGHPMNNLVGYGCFYIVGKKFEDLPVSEQQRILDEANDKHNQKCREKVLEADQLWSNPVSKGWLTDMYRLCAIHIGEEREWVAKRGRSSPVQECPFCGWEVKRGIAKCTNCREILDKELYEKLKADRN